MDFENPKKKKNQLTILTPAQRTWILKWRTQIVGTRMSNFLDGLHVKKRIDGVFVK